MFYASGGKRVHILVVNKENCLRKPMFGLNFSFAVLFYCVCCGVCLNHFNEVLVDLFC